MSGAGKRPGSRGTGTGLGKGTGSGKGKGTSTGSRNTGSRSTDSRNTGSRNTGSDAGSYRDGTGTRGKRTEHATRPDHGNAGNRRNGNRVSGQPARAPVADAAEGKPRSFNAKPPRPALARDGSEPRHRNAPRPQERSPRPVSSQDKPFVKSAAEKPASLRPDAKSEPRRPRRTEERPDKRANDRTEPRTETRAEPRAEPQTGTPIPATGEQPLQSDGRNRSDPNQGNFLGRKRPHPPRSAGVTKPSFRKRLAAQAETARNAQSSRPQTQKPDRGAARKPASLIPDQSGLAARIAAVDLISSVLDEKRMLDDTLARASAAGSLAGLEPRDRALARLIAATTLRRLGQIDDAVLRFLERGFPSRTGVYPHVLRAAVAQLMFLDTPAHAAINIAVSQAKLDARSRPFGALTNAVLRRVVDHMASVTASQDPIALNTPAWMLERWREAYGEETARQIAKAHLHEAPLDLTVRANAASWAERLSARLLPTGSIRLDQRGRIEDIEGYDSGEWWVQDAAAALPVRLLGNVAGARVADICAAPGGKTMQLASAGAEVTAIDISPTRLDRLKANLTRAKLEASLIAADASTWTTTDLFDAILLDAPCSATGTIRRHPDIPHLKSAEDLPTLISLQRQILRNVVRFLAPGGTLVYCTCSLEAEEGPDQIVELLARDDTVELVPIDPAEIGADPDWITPEGYLRTLPIHLPDLEPRLSGLDGFFAARIRRKPNPEAG